MNAVIEIKDAELEKEISEFVDVTWQEVGHDLIASCADPDAGEGEQYEQGVEGFKDYIGDRLSDEYGSELLEAIKETVDAVIEKFNG